MICNAPAQPCRKVNVRPITIRIKVSTPDYRPICGAVYQLARDDGKFLNGISDNCGIVSFCGVTPGEYELTQLERAYGYLIDSTVHPVAVSDCCCVKIDGVAVNCFRSINAPDPALAPTESASPTIDQPTEETLTLTGTGVPGCRIEITFPAGYCASAIVKRGGQWSVDVPEHCTLEEGDVIQAVQTCECQLPSAPESITVDPATP